MTHGGSELLRELGRLAVPAWCLLCGRLWPCNDLQLEHQQMAGILIKYTTVAFGKCDDIRRNCATHRYISFCGKRRWNYAQRNSSAVGVSANTCFSTVNAAEQILTRINIKFEVGATCSCAAGRNGLPRRAIVIGENFRCKSHVRFYRAPFSHSLTPPNIKTQISKSHDENTGAAGTPYRVCSPLYFILHCFYRFYYELPKSLHFNWPERAVIGWV